MSKNTKLTVWLVIVGILSGIFWWDAKIWLQGSLFDAGNYRPSLVGAIVVLAGIIGAGYIIFQEYLNSIIPGILIGVGYIVFFGVNPVNLITAAIVLLLFFHAHANVAEELSQRTKINAKMALKRAVSPILLAIFLLMSFGAYQSPAIKSFDNLKQLPTSTEQMIRSVVEAVVGPQIENQGASQADMDQIFKRVTREVLGQLNTLAGPYLVYAPPVIAFGLFITLWSLMWLFALLSRLVGMAVFYIWKRVGWFRIEEKDVKAETLIV